MLNPVSHALAMAPLEDEEIGEEEDRAVARSKEWFKHHEGTPFEDVVVEMGFSMVDQIRKRRGTGLKRIVFSDDAKADIGVIARQVARSILSAIRLAETSSGRVKTLQGSAGDKRLRVGGSPSALRRRRRR